MDGCNRQRQTEMKKFKFYAKTDAYAQLVNETQ